MKKKLLALLLAALMLLSLAACGDKAPKDPADVKGTTYETSMISVLVPDGWKEFPKSDISKSIPTSRATPMA